MIPWLALSKFNKKCFYEHPNADDSTVSASAEKIEDIGAVLSHDCEQLSSWMVANRFRLNADKTRTC